jgi:hypothetical protein
MAEDSSSGQEGAEGAPERLDSIEDLEPSEAAKYELKGGYYYRRPPS